MKRLEVTRFATQYNKLTILVPSKKRRRRLRRRPSLGVVTVLKSTPPHIQALLDKFE